MDLFWSAPPVIRTICALTVAASVPIHMGLVSWTRVAFYTPWVFGKFPPELWRVFTSFLLTGPKLGMLMDPYFLWIYGSSLETESPRFSRPGDFFAYIVFVELVTVLKRFLELREITPALPQTHHSQSVKGSVGGVGMVGMALRKLLIGGVILGGFTFLDALTLAFAYTHAQDNPNRQVSFFIITMRAKFLPLAMLAMTFVSGSPESALKQASGLVAAHLYDFLTRIWPTHGGGTNYIQTPAVISRWFGADARVPQARNYGSAIPGRPAPPGRTAPAPAGGSVSTGWSSSVPSWNSRGSGRRLGGD